MNAMVPAITTEVVHVPVAPSVVGSNQFHWTVIGMGILEELNLRSEEGARCAK